MKTNSKESAIQTDLLVAVLLAWPTVVQAQFTYTTNNGAITITGYTGSGGAVTIPATINGLPVTGIGHYAFYSSSLTSATIPDSVTSVGDGAFYFCQNLTNVTIGNSVTSIGDYAFYYCGLIDVTIGSGVTNVGSYTFSLCWRLPSVTIPDSVTSIGDEAFAVCYGLTAIIVAANNPAYSSVNGVLFDKSQTTLTQFPPSKAGSYTVPYGVMNIADYAFYECYALTSVTIPNSVTSIGDDAFRRCSGLTNVMIASGVTNIGGDAFADSTSLKVITVEANNTMYCSVDGVLFDKSQTTLITYPTGIAGGYAIPYGVTNIGEGAFYDCSSLTSITFPDSITRIGDEAFSGCVSLTGVTIPNRVTNIRSYTFYGCGLTNVTIGSGVTNIGGYAFSSCWSLPSVTIPDSVTSIGDDVFSECYGLTNVTIGNGVTTIGVSAFSECNSLTSVTIPNSVISIGDYAFAGYYGLGLTNVTIGNSVTSIGSYAFYYCGLTSVYFKGNAPAADYTTFVTYYFEGLIPIYEATAYYLPGSTGWSGFSATTHIPTVQWLPLIQTGDAGFGVRTNQFGFNIAWASGQTVVLEAVTNLSNPNWIPVATNTLASDSVYFSDPQWTKHPARFYRLRSP